MSQKLNRNHCSNLVFLILVFTSNCCNCHQQNNGSKLVESFTRILFKLSKPVVLSSFSNINISASCRRDSQLYYSDLQELKLWAVKMYDATGKFPSGLLNGNVHVTGDINLCHTIVEKINRNYEILGKFCQASIFAEPYQSNSNIDSIMDSVHSHRNFKSDYNDVVQFFPTFSQMSWSFCIPSSCTSEDLELFLLELVKPFNLTSSLELHIKVSHRSCETKKEINYQYILNSPSFVIISIMFAGIFLSIFCGIYDYFYNFEYYLHRNTTVLTQNVYAWSIRRNWKLLINLTDESDDIKCVHGIRFVFSIAIYLLHRSVFGLFQPFSNRTEIAELMEGTASMVFRAFWSHVDTFVILSGLLTSYYAVKKLQSGARLNIKTMYFKRYLKFAPIYYLILSLIQCIEDYESSPTMFRVVNHFIDDCKSGLWKSYLFISNVDGINNMCYPPAHQLLTDFQMYLVAPFLILFLWKRSQYATTLLFFLLAALTLFKAITMYTGRFGSVIYYGITLNEMLASADALYLNPLHRAPPYVCGIALGYYLRIWKKQYISSDQRNVGWCIALICAYYSFFGLSEASFRGYKYNPMQETLYGITQPLMWSFTICWLIYICHSGYGGALNTFLSWKCFQLFSRIAYPFYMCQILLIFYRMAGVRVPLYIKMTEVFDLNEIVLIIGCSILLTIVYMYPVAHLYSIITYNTGQQMKRPEPKIHRQYVENIKDGN